MLHYFSMSWNAMFLVLLTLYCVIHFIINSLHNIPLSVLDYFTREHSALLGMIYAGFCPMSPTHEGQNPTGSSDPAGRWIFNPSCLRENCLGGQKPHLVAPLEGWVRHPCMKDLAETHEHPWRVTHDGGPLRVPHTDFLSSSSLYFILIWCLLFT